ncbi:MAG TPA: sigma 54-interacting transcriptional regulator [Blastocatellia bacterium]|nr:sigma 54-interacting transcriptional regulator [Blastocatellia bacterium]
MSTYSVLVVDDDPQHLQRIRTLLESALKSQKKMLGLFDDDKVTFELETDAGRVVRDIESGAVDYDIILADIYMPLDGGAPTVAGGAKRIYNAIKEHGLGEDLLLIVISNRDSDAAPHFREVWREQQLLDRPWAINYPKPESLPGPDLDEGLFDDNTWIYAICRAIGRHRDNQWRQTFIQSTLYEIVGFSAALMKAKVLAEQYADERLIILTGETGTGKEMIARAIHENSQRTTGTLKAINCNLSPEGLIETEIFGAVKGAYTGLNEHRPSLFEQSNHGTVFLDEFGSDAERLKVLDQKLRRVIQPPYTYRKVGGSQDMPFHGTVILGGSKLTHLRPPQISDDFYGRMGLCRINLPPLRDRRSDVAPLAEIFLKKHSDGASKTISQEAIKVLEEYHWPGNVRQLENLMKYCAKYLMKDTIETQDVVKGLDLPAAQSLVRGVAPLITKDRLLEAARRPDVNTIVKLTQVLYPEYTPVAIKSWARKKVNKLINQFTEEDPAFLSQIPWYHPRGGRPAK